MDLSTLKPADGAVTRDDLRRGRGHGSGNGKTAGKGHKGRRLVQVLQDLASKVVEMPLFRRIPKRGFTCRNSKNIVALNVSIQPFRRRR